MNSLSSSLHQHFNQGGVMLRVNEIFGPTIQGEGKNAGKPVAFLRLAICNLHCSFCDTKFTWSFAGSQDSERYNMVDEVHYMRISDILAKLLATGMKHLVISGGEPLLQHKQLVYLLEILKLAGWFVEVETNGTVYPNDSFVNLIDQINCSPKLSNSGERFECRIKEQALINLVLCGKANFKFVIQTTKDLDEAVNLMTTYHMKDVRFMPECRTPEELKEKEEWLKPLCERMGVIYCTRLSILNGNRRGT